MSTSRDLPGAGQPNGSDLLGMARSWAQGPLWRGGAGQGDIQRRRIARGVAQSGLFGSGGVGGS